MKTGLLQLDDYPELREFVDSHRILFNAATHQVKKVEALLEKLAKPFETQPVRLQGVPETSANELFWQVELALE